MVSHFKLVGDHSLYVCVCVYTVPVDDSEKNVVFV